MRQVIKISFSVFGIIIMCMLLSCKKQETKPVPGPQGDKGTPADTGNVVLSEETFTASAWSLSINTWESTYNTGAITNNAAVSGDVEVYMKIGEKWWTLPYAVGDIFMQATFEQQTLHLKYFKIHGGPPAKPDTVTFRIVVLEPVQ